MNDVQSAYEYLYNLIYVPVFLDRLEKRGYHTSDPAEIQYLLAMGHALYDQSQPEMVQSMVKAASYIEHDEVAQAVSELVKVPSVRESVVTLLKAANHGGESEAS